MDRPDATVASPAVQLLDVVKRYPGPHGDVAAVDGISLTVEEGQVFSLLGPNGAGKTTTIEMLVGLRRPTSGSVRTLGLDPVRERDAVRRRVSVQPQHAAVFEQQTVLELLSVWASFYPDPDSPAAVLERLGLTAARDVRVGTLSGGQRQRLLVGLALVSRPELLVLDEPSTGMDPNARGELWSAIRDVRAGGGTVLLSTHSMEEAESMSDRVAILDHGRVVADGTPDELVARYAPECEIGFTVEPGADTGWLERHEDVRDLTAQDRSGTTRITLRTTASDAVLGVLGARLGARNISVRDAGLEAVFRRVTGRDLPPDGDEGELVAASTTGGHR